MAESAENEVGYFHSYSYIGIHEEMIKDSVRTKSYERAILQNEKMFKNKIVLDVGCGSGILSLFAAKAGAKHVYAVDNSEIAKKAKEVVSTNNYNDIITVIHGKIEEIDLPVDKVDIIISEWMGYSLLFESMLDTVIVARDKWLAEGGIIMPDKASIYISAIEDTEYFEEKITWWENVYGFDMSPMKDGALSEALVDVVKSNSVVTNRDVITTINLYNVKSEDLMNINRDFRLTVVRNDFIHAFIVYFDVEFTACHKPVIITTAPFAKYTHWKQTIFYINNFLTSYKDDVIRGKIIIKKGKKNQRHLDIFIGVYDEGKSSFQQSRNYLLS